MVNKIILLRLLVTLATSVVAAPRKQNLQSIQLLRHENSIDEDGYEFEYALSDGTLRRETGTNDEGILRVSGSYEFIAPDGTKFVVEYTADKNGYRPLSKMLESIDGSIHPHLDEASLDLGFRFRSLSGYSSADSIEILRHAPKDLRESIIG